MSAHGDWTADPSGAGTASTHTPAGGATSATLAARDGSEGPPAELRNLVGGSWTPADEVEWVDDVDPATGRPVARVPMSGPKDVDAAVRAARAAQRGWAEVPPQARARAVMELRDVLDRHREEIARLVVSDMGKTFADALGEVGRGIESVEAATAIPHLLKGETLEGVASGVDVELHRRPVGVVAAITPFNFPAMIPLWFLPFAIGCGNAIVLKPSERDPLAAVRICELAAEVGTIPPGVVSLVHGGREAVSAILDHPGIDAISFVGQASTARLVAERAAATGKRAQALGGAKNSMVVMPDAPLEEAVEGICASAFGAAGQRCLAGSVAVLVGGRERQDEVAEAISRRASELVTGPGADGSTDVCPLIAPEAREGIEAAIGRALAEGARPLLDGRTGGGPAGTELGPTVLEAPDRESELAREELFGPVLALVRATDLDDALGFVNGSRYGNATSIFTASGSAARRYRSEVRVGMVGVNVGVAAPVAWFPFAGWGDSFDGDLHANGRDAVTFYTRAQVVTSRW